MTRTRLLGVLGFVALLSAGTVAAEGARHLYTFKIVENGVETVVQVDNRQAGFSLTDLSPGETRFAPGTLGENVALSCIEDNYVVNVDGRVFNIPVNLQATHSDLTDNPAEPDDDALRSPVAARQPVAAGGHRTARGGGDDDVALEIIAEVSPQPGADDGVFYLQRLVVKKKKGKKKR